MLLETRDLKAFYGSSQALFGVSLSVEEGEVVSLMGRNGMGKTTTICSIMGMLPAHGEIHFEGERVDGHAPHRMAQLGIGLVPEGRRIFPNLTVRENLVMASTERAYGQRWDLDRIHELFPRLRERSDNLGGKLSGGEQQMLAIGRALMTNPKLLILDEATEGLAPAIRDLIWECLHRLKRTGLAILVVDKEVDSLCELADRHYAMDKGLIAWSGSTAALKADPLARETYLGL